MYRKNNNKMTSAEYQKEVSRLTAELFKKGAQVTALNKRLTEDSKLIDRIVNKLNDELPEGEKKPKGKKLFKILKFVWQIIILIVQNRDKFKKA